MDDDEPYRDFSVYRLNEGEGRGRKKNKLKKIAGKVLFIATTTTMVYDIYINIRSGELSG